MYVLKSDSLFENERFFASIPPFKFVFCSKCSVSKERINNFGRRASIFQNVHISRRESLTLKKTPWQIQLAYLGKQSHAPVRYFSHPVRSIAKRKSCCGLKNLKLFPYFYFFSDCFVGETLISTYPWVPKMKRSSR